MRLNSLISMVSQSKSLLDCIWAGIQLTSPYLLGLKVNCIVILLLHAFGGELLIKTKLLTGWTLMDQWCDSAYKSFDIVCIQLR